MKATAYILFFLLASGALGADVYQLPHEAVAAAVEDARQADHPELFRYVWIPDGDEKKARFFAYGFNEAANRGDLIVHPKLFSNGYVMRWDFFLLAGADEKIAKELLLVWEKFADDEPYFLTDVLDDEVHLPAGGVKVIEETATHFKVQMDKPFTQDGKSYTQKWFPKSELKGKKKDRVFSPAAGVDKAEELIELTGSRVPIVRVDWVHKRALSTIERGVYYALRGIERNPKEGTAQQAFLKQFGADEEDSANRRALLEGLQKFSEVTAKPRRWKLIHGRSPKVSEGQAIVAIVEDPKDDETDPDFDIFKNVKKSRFAASEIIAELPTGLHAYALFDGNGALQDAAPDFIVKDHEIPRPYTARLQGAIACIRCHNKKAVAAGAGWQPLFDDFRAINKKAVDVFGEKRKHALNVQDTFIIAGRHTGDFDKALTRARDDYTDAVVRVSNGMDFQEVSDGTVKLYGDYWYERIGAAEACKEIGEAVPEGVKPSDHLLATLAVPDADEFGIIEEHPTFGALFADVKVSRLDWEEVYGQAVFRKLEKAKQKAMP